MLPLHAACGAEEMKVWPSGLPAGCPQQASADFTALGFTGRHANYSQADTWYPSWGADGRLYSPFTDGTVDQKQADGKVVPLKSWSGGAGAVVGHAIIKGDDPLKLTITDPGLVAGNPAPYGGRYPCASLHHNGTWYLGTYALANAPYGLNWPICGPFAGFHISKDNGKTWTPTPRSCQPGQGVFPEPGAVNGPVRFGVPHVVDFGKNMEHSPDGMMYLVAHGSTQPDGKDRNANCSWITGDEINLCRVKPSPETVNDPAAYEYFAGHDTSGKPVWTRDFTKVRPLIDWNNHCGGVTITYNKPLGRYLMCVTNGGDTQSRYDTYLLESRDITGPWKTITYMKDFGTQAYFVNIPSKFISPDGRSFWLCYSANWYNQMKANTHPSNPPGSHYTMSLHEVRLVAPGKP